MAGGSTNGKLLLEISHILEEMHCGGCPADAHCDFWKRHVEALAKIKRVLANCRMPKGSEWETWTEL